LNPAYWINRLFDGVRELDNGSAQPLDKLFAIAAAPFFVEKLDAPFNVRAEHRQQLPRIPVVVVATPGALWKLQ
jgi:hypothetical protein